MNSLSAVKTASDIQMDYMKLLVTQLRNQDPLEPLDNNQMASQLAQLSQLQQLETMNGSFSKVLDNVERTYAASLLGKNVSFLTETENGMFDTKNGTVDQVHNNVNGEIFLTIGDQAIRLEDVLSLKE